MKKSLVFISIAGIMGCGVEAKEVDPNTGKQLLDIPVDEPALGKADTYNGGYGPSASGLSSTSKVWHVHRRWYQTDSAAGIAWAQGSQLTWDEKYAAWIEQLKQIDSEGGWSKTFELLTPWGKRVPGPALECAEAGMFLRATFASWYGLPFYMEAYSSTHGRVYYGHFGVVKRSGARVPGTPKYGTSYKDHTGDFAGKTDAQVVASWPEDGSLRTRYLTTLKDDRNPFLGQDAYSGAYFDEIFLNKRVGYFLLRLLTHFGSMHVANAKNTFNLKPEAIREGDVLVERWQKQGIGHVMVVKTVNDLGGGNLDAEIVYGSMPRIQPKWYSAAISKSYFISNYSGGQGQNSDGDDYAKLGGGLKRWRTPVVKYGRWYNIVPVRDRGSHISSYDYQAIGARPTRFEQLLGQMTPEQQRDVLLQQIEIARQNLKLKPASCANRQRREEAFTKLYVLNQQHFNLSKEQTDRAHRKLEDYVFAPLEYNKSKTCCWNSTTTAMYEIVMQYNSEHVYDAQTQTCNAPVVFKAASGAYDLFKQYAVSIGRGAEWVDWSADESCPQASDPNLTDTESPQEWTPLCSIADAIFGGGDNNNGGGGSPYVDGETCPTGLDWEGLCEGNRVVWCQSNEVNSYTCSSGNACGWDDANNYYWCI